MEHTIYAPNKKNIPKYNEEKEKKQKNKLIN